MKSSASERVLNLFHIRIKYLAFYVHNYDSKRQFPANVVYLRPCSVMCIIPGTTLA